MKVNMTPNPLDVVTIHASQGDTEARQWEFELHNNGELIDTSEITEQLFFKAYKGGTEQILPENGSTPTTSPFIGDIKYPQGLLTDQEFLYRESPTEEDGLAFIKNIKGNTLVWNQLVQNGNFESTSGWTLSDSVSASASNNVLTATIGTTHHSSIRLANSNIPMQSGRKYLFCCDVKPTKNITVRIQYGGVATDITSQVMTANVWGRYSSFANMTATNNVNFYYNIANSLTEGDTVQFRNCVLFDLSQMGLDSIASVDEFKALFPLPFYQYEQGKLLSFNGNGIKTVSKNQFDTSVVTTSYAGLTLTKTQGTIRAVYSGGSQYVGFNFYGSPVFTDTFLKGKYRLSFDVKGLDTQWTVGLRQGASFLGGGQAVAFSNNGHHSFTIDTKANPNCYLSFARTGNKTTAYDVTFSNIQLELGTTETSYTPFEEKTISLPISTYFPTGMKSAGSVYDELTNSKAITRVGAVDLGTLTWGRNPTAIANRYRFYSDDLQNIAKAPTSNAETSNIICSTFSVVSYNTLYNSDIDKVITISSAGVISAVDSSYTDATSFKTAMSGVYLYYELATPTETSFTTASLVTENAEIPLSNEDGTLIGKCTEQLSSESGFFDAKIKLADDDGECYSNKIQLHVERSPQ